jgi:NADH:ubiquinone oxidoreductase subunit H
MEAELFHEDTQNRVGFVGIFQPFSDAIKLFTKEQYFPLVDT